jgi:hypothetical protein
MICSSCLANASFISSSTMMNWIQNAVLTAGQSYVSQIRIWNKSTLLWFHSQDAIGHYKKINYTNNAHSMFTSLKIWHCNTSKHFHIWLCEKFSNTKITSWVFALLGCSWHKMFAGYWHFRLHTGPTSTDKPDNSYNKITILYNLAANFCLPK